MIIVDANIGIIEQKIRIIHLILSKIVIFQPKGMLKHITRMLKHYDTD